jgi:hypothetical protein
MQKFLGILLLGVGVSAMVIAAVPAAPEIDPASGVSALTLLAGALLVVRGRRRK